MFLQNWRFSFFLQIAKVVGISLASLLYNVALSSSSGATRERIQALGFYFDSQVIAEFLLFHATLVYAYIFLPLYFDDFFCQG